MEQFDVVLTIISSVVIGVFINIVTDPVKKALALMFTSQRKKRIEFIEFEIQFMKELGEDESLFYHKTIEKTFYLIKHTLIALVLLFFAVFSYYAREVSPGNDANHIVTMFTLALIFFSGSYFSYIAGYASSWHKRVLDLYELDEYISKAEVELIALKEKLCD